MFERNVRELLLEGNVAELAGKHACAAMRPGDVVYLLAFAEKECPQASFEFLIDAGWASLADVGAWFVNFASRAPQVAHAFRAHPDLRHHAFWALERLAAQRTPASCAVVDLVLLSCTGEIREHINLSVHWMGVEGIRAWVQDWCPHCRDKALPLGDCIRTEQECTTVVHYGIIPNIERAYSNDDDKGWGTLLRHVLTCGFLAPQSAAILVARSFHVSVSQKAARRTIEDRLSSISTTAPIDAGLLLKLCASSSFSYSGAQAEWVMSLLGSSLVGRVDYRTVLGALGRKAADALCASHPGLVDAAHAPRSNFLRAPGLLMHADLRRVDPGTILQVLRKAKDAEALATRVMEQCPSLVCDYEPLAAHVWKRRRGIRPLWELLRSRTVTPLLLGLRDPRSPVSLLDRHTLTAIINQIH